MKVLSSCYFAYVSFSRAEGSVRRTPVAPSSRAPRLIEQNRLRTRRPLIQR